VLLGVKSCREDRTPRRAGHHFVDVGIVPHIQYAGGAGPTAIATIASEPSSGSRETGRNHHSDECGEHRKQHHAWLHEREKSDARVVKPMRGSACG